MEQQVRFCTAGDGVRLAYAVHGRGPPLVRAATWLTHLDFDWESPVWRHWLAELGDGHTLVRYDERGCGLSDRELGELSRRDLGRRSRDGRRRRGPRSLRAARRLAGRGDRGRLRGAASRAGHRPRPLRRLRARPDVARRRGSARRRGAGLGDPRGLDGAEPGVPPRVQHAVPPARHRRADGVVRRAAAALDLRRDRGAALRGARRASTCSTSRARVTTPTLVAARARRPRRAGRGGPAARRAASRAPGSSCWSRRTTSCSPTSRPGSDFRVRAPTRSSAREPRRRPTAVAELSPRELEVLELVAGGLTNEAIAERLCLSVRTVERHLSNIYAKLRVSGKAGRAAAAVRFSEALRAGRQPTLRRVACWRRCRRGRRARSVAATARRTAQGGRRHRDGAHARASTRRSRREPIATHEVRGGGGLRLHVREWGDPQGPPIVFVHGWSQSPAVLGAADRRPARRGLPASSPSTSAATACPRSRWTPSTTPTRGCGPTTSHAVIEQLGLDRPVLVAWSYGGFVVTDYLARLRRGGDRRPQPRRRRGAAHARLRPHRARPARERRRRVREPTCRRTSPPSAASCAPARRSRSATTTGARRCAGTWSCRPRCEGRCSRARSTPTTSSRACRCRCSSPTGAPTRSCCPRWPSTCSTSAGRRGPPGTRASATCRSSRTRPVRPRAARVRARREQGGGDHAPGVRVRAVARRDARATLRR